MTEKNALDEATLQRYEEALTNLGYVVYDVNGKWFLNTEDCDDQNLADGPYDTKATALEASVKSLGLEVEPDDDEPSSTPTCG